jgi:hypothetical protein
MWVACRRGGPECSRDHRPYLIGTHTTGMPQLKTLPASLNELQARVAIVTTDVDIIHRNWEEMAYSRDICWETRGNLIEQL